MGGKFRGWYNMTGEDMMRHAVVSCRSPLTAIDVEEDLQMNRQYYLGPTKAVIHCMVPCSSLTILRNGRYIVPGPWAKLSKLHSLAWVDTAARCTITGNQTNGLMIAFRPQTNQGHSPRRVATSRTTNGGDFLGVIDLRPETQSREALQR